VHMARRVRSLSKRTISQVFGGIHKENSTSKLSEENLYTVFDDIQPLSAMEKSWPVKMKDEHGAYNERLLCVAPRALRLVHICTHEEIEVFELHLIQRISACDSHKSFQLTWVSPKNGVEVVSFKTNKASEINNAIKELIRNVLSEQNVSNPDRVIEANSFMVRHDRAKLKTGGRHPTDPSLEKRFIQTKIASKENIQNWRNEEKIALL